MKRTIFCAAFVILLGAAADADSLAEKTGVNAVLNISPSTADFVHDAALGGMFEIQSSKLAKEKASGPLIDFAQTMIDDHAKASDELKSLVDKGAAAGVTLPTALNDSYQKKLDQLRDENGAEFTKTYIDDQVAAHKDAVSLFERYAKGGDNDALKQWAQKTLPVLRHHLAMAEDLKKNKPAG